MADYDSQKTASGQCESYIEANGVLERCRQTGTRRTDKGLDSGIHCDSCWGKMISDCRQRSW